MGGTGSISEIARIKHRQYHHLPFRVRILITFDLEGIVLEGLDRCERLYLPAGRARHYQGQRKDRGYAVAQ
jgi:hypothetical protein